MCWKFSSALRTSYSFEEFFSYEEFLSNFAELSRIMFRSNWDISEFLEFHTNFSVIL